MVWYGKDDDEDDGPRVIVREEIRYVAGDDYCQLVDELKKILGDLDHLFRGIQGPIPYSARALREIRRLKECEKQLIALIGEEEK